VLLRKRDLGNDGWRAVQLKEPTKGSVALGVSTSAKGSEEAVSATTRGR